MGKTDSTARLGQRGKVYADGLPATQSELIGEMIEWSQTRQDEHTPDEGTVRRKVALVWRELTGA